MALSEIRFIWSLDIGSIMYVAIAGADLENNLGRGRKRYMKDQEEF